MFTLRFKPVIGVLAIAGLLFSGCGKSEPDTPTPTPGPSTVAVTGVSVGSASLSLTEGGTGTVSYTVSPSNATNQGVSFKSSDSSVASVDANGKVTAGKPGTATITVTTADGGKTATCTVTVTAKTVSVTGVKLDKTTLDLAVGKSQKLTATVEPSNATNKEVTWKSSDDKVATVGTDGTVTGVKAGEVTISVTTKDGSKSATCKVTVTAKTVAVTGVTLNKSTLTITVGETFKLVPTIKPDNATNKEVEWKSSNTAVATVAEDGTVTGVKAGTATITCTTKDGSKKATCAVTVKAATVAVTGVTLDTDKLVVIIGTPQKLTATVAPSNATNKEVTWSSSNTSVATVGTDGTVKGVKTGTATITCTTKDGSKKATCAVTVYPKPDSVWENGKTTNGEIAEGATITINNGDWFTYLPYSKSSKVIIKDGTYSEFSATSSNTSVGRVEVYKMENYYGWRISAHKAGTSTITLTYRGVKIQVTLKVIDIVVRDYDGNDLKSSITVTKTITDPEPLRFKFYDYAANKYLSFDKDTHNDITITSSNTSVVSNDVSWNTNHISVNLKTAGTATLTFYYKGVIIHQTQVTVKAPTSVSVTGVTLDKTSLTLTVNETYKLVPTVSPSNATNKEVTWSSSNTSVATVGTDGTVKGIKAGTATITCTSKADGNKKATCTVTVKLKPVYTVMAPAPDNNPDHMWEIRGANKYYLTLHKSGMEDTRHFRLYDTANKEWVVNTSGLKVSSSATNIVSTSVGNYSNYQLGGLTGLRHGEADITVTYGDFKATFKVVVIDFVIRYNNKTVTSIDYKLGTDSQDYIYIKFYDDYTNTYGNPSYMAITYSSDSSVVKPMGYSSDYYYLKALKAGKAVITFRDGCGGVIGEVTITVTK